MKRHLLILVSAILLLTSCSSDENKNVNTQNNELQEIDFTTGKEVLSEINGFCGIIYFDSKQILFVKDGEINKEFDTADKLFYHYNLNNNLATLITKVKNVSFSTQDIAFFENHLYYPLSIKNDEGLIEYILEISLDDFGSRLVKSSSTDSKVTKLATANNILFRYYQIDLASEETDFFIDNLGTLDSEENVIYAKYVDYSGEILINMCTYENSIYTYSVIYNKVTQYVIREFSLAGNLLMEYQLDLDEFLKLKEVDDTDIVYRIFREGEYIILNTLNNRVKIYKIADTKLIEVETPEEFEKLLEARVIENYGYKNGYVFFQNGIRNDELYIFDTENCIFSKFKLFGNGFQLYHVIRDSDGSIIIITRNSDNEYKYFLFDLLKVLIK